LYIQGDATDDDNLLTAGIEVADGIVSALPSDKDNLYVTMSARMLNRKIRIIARMIDQKLEAKLRKAGANRVVSPNAIGALRMASELIRPAAVDFLDSMLRSRRGNLRIHQLTISSGSTIVDKSLAEADLVTRYGLLVLGARSTTGEVEFNPSPRQQLSAGTTLIVMGDVEDIVKAQKDMLSPEVPAS
jgi:voltage-gated potassium channel